ncbi:MAG: DEAD/DEAH box helicase [Planctomycetaceae bacterium]|jgi:ATP-dependent RNA helicase DeaD|nr:DEAD/DEAH box helicase [Planctomycetaceae bacterium]
MAVKEKENESNKPKRQFRPQNAHRGEDYVDRFRWDYVEGHGTEQESGGTSVEKSGKKEVTNDTKNERRTPKVGERRKPQHRTAAAVPRKQHIPVPVIDEDENDLNLPSYGRTAMVVGPSSTPVSAPVVPAKRVPPKTGRERPQRNIRKDRIVRREEGDGNETTTPAFSPQRPVASAPGSLHKEQVVWDPVKLEYVSLVREPKEYLPNKGLRTRQEPELTGTSGPKTPRKPVRKRTEREENAADTPNRPAAPCEKSREKFSERVIAKFPEESPEKREPQIFSAPPRTAPPVPKERSETVDIPPERRRYDPADIEAEPNGFTALGVSDAMLEALKVVRYLEPTPIQAGVFQKVREGGDLMGQAQTGTGKTAAFCIPIIEGIESCPPGNDPVALILVPTRELAVQVRDEAVRLSYGRDSRITACYGGKPLGKQIERLRNGVDVIVGTPGRILDLMRRGSLVLASLRWIVLDEADRMLDIGFRPDIEKILKQTPPERQMLLFSATLPPPVVRLAERYMKSPEVLDFSNKNVAVETIEQFYITVDHERKFDALVCLLNEQQPAQAIVFTRTKRGADRLARNLSKKFEGLAAIHGDLPQGERDTVMARVRNGKIRYLVATDVVGRGIDVSGISHIINYDIPKFCDDYIHRVGRTGRMGREGVAYTFVTVEEGAELTRIEMRIDKLLKRTDLKGFESFTKPHDRNVTLEGEAAPAETKPVFSKRVRRVRNAL